MTIILRRPWKQQPQSPAGLDPKWGLRPALVFTPAHRDRWAYGSGITSAASSQGLRAVLPGGTQTSANVITRAGGITAAQTRCTFVCVVDLAASGDAYATIASLKYSAVNEGLYFGDITGSGNEIGIVKGGVAALSAVTLSAPGTYVLVASHRQDTGAYYVLARNVATGAVLRNTQTDTSASSAGNGTYALGSTRSDGVTGSWNGGVYLAVGSFDWLPEVLGLELLKSPWQIFAPIERRIWVPDEAPGGVPSITAVYAENILATSADYRVTLDFA